MAREEFRELMVKLVQAAGKELIDRAEDFVGDGDLMCAFHISIDILMDGKTFGNVPTITVSREHVCKECVKVFADME